MKLDENDEIVFVVDNPFPYYAGGREVWLYAVAKRLSKKYSVTIFVYGLDGEKEPKFPVGDIGARVERMPAFHKAMRKFPHYGELAANMMFLVYTAFTLRRRFSRKKGTIILVGMNAGTCYLSTFPMRKKNHRRICNVHGKWEAEMSRLYPPFRSLFRIMGKESYRDSHIVMTSGYSDIDYVRGIAGTDDFERKLRPLPLAVELMPFLSAEPELPEPCRKEKIITMCATLSVWKGVPELIKAIPYIKNGYNGDFKVVFVGKGEKREFEQLAQKLGVRDYVEFAGEKPRIELVNVLQRSDIAACNFGGGGGPPAALLEAMAVGKPIVAWDTKLVNTAVKHGESAYLVPENDTEALGKAIARLLNDPDYAKKLGANAKREAEKYDIDRMLGKFIEILEYAKSLET
jgi:glycosyltransferase involved in cell wall biosynthesis